MHIYIYMYINIYIYIYILGVSILRTGFYGLVKIAD